MEKKTVLFTPKGAIAKEDKKLLSDQNYLVIEIDNPDQIKTIHDLGLVGSDIIITSALAVINKSSSATIHEWFKKEVMDRTMAKLKNK